MKWLYRDFIQGPYLCLVVDEAGFHKALRHCKVKPANYPQWLSESAAARTHILANAHGKATCIVAINPESTSEPIELCALLVHEAVHVWQYHCENIGEEKPSAEFEAYSIQTIAQRLMYAYADCLKGSA